MMYRYFKILLLSGTTLIFMCVLLGAQSAAAVDKSGVKPNVLSLPKGAGSVEGLGESFEPQLNTGTSVYSIKIALPPGRAGFAPGLALSYNAGSGNSEFGIGWSLSIPKIQRKTDKGIPTYSDQDIFIYEGEELAHLSDETWRCENEGSFTRLVRKPDHWESTDRNGTRHIFGQYFSTSGGRTSRINRGVTDTFNETYCWCLDTSIDLNGNTIQYFYSTFADSPGRLYISRIRYNSPARNGETDNGPAMEVRFDYTEPAAAGAVAQKSTGPKLTPQAYRQRLATGEKGLPQDRVLKAAAAQATGLPVPTAWKEPVLLTTTANTRPDALLDFRPGFPVRLGRRCRAIEVWEGTRLIRSYKLDYEEAAPTGAAGIPSDLSLLRRVTEYGAGGNANTYLPPLTLDYTMLARPSKAAVNSVTNPPRFPLSDANTQIMDLNADGLPDIVHIEPGETRYWLNMGVSGGKVQFSDEKRLVNLPGDIQLAHTAIQLADMDGNGASDLVYYKGPGSGNFSTFANPSQVAGYADAKSYASFGSEQPWVGPAPFTLGAPNVQFLDLNFDKLTDVMVSTAFGFNYYLNDQGKKWTDLGSTDFGSAAMGNIPAGTGFDQPGVSLADMNGDRMQDLVKLVIDNGLITVYYWHNRGNQRWDLGRVMLGNTYAFSDNLTDLRVMDVNGDGLADLVALGTGTPHSRLRYWINKGNGEYSSPVTFDETNSALPEYTATTTIRTADMDGNGMTDLVYANGTKIEYLDFAGGGPRPNLLRQIDNGIGRRITIDYGSSVDFMLADKAKGQPWGARPPFPVQVVSTITTEMGPGFDLNEDGKQDAYHTSIYFHDGIYDGFEKEFRGFNQVDRVEWGDDYDWATQKFNGGRVGNAKSVTLVSRYKFHSGTADGVDNDEYPAGYAGPTPTDERTTEGGAEEECLKGKPLWEEKVDGAALWANALKNGQFAPDKYTYTRTEYTYKIRRLYRLQGEATAPAAAFPGVVSINGRQVSFPMQIATLTHEIEANGYLNLMLGTPLKDPAELLTEQVYDNYGNVTRATDWGLVQNHGLNLADRQYMDDERVSIKSFIPPTADRWLLDRESEERVEDEAGAFVSMARTYYDGADFIGLPLGQLGSRGLATRVEKYINGTQVPPPNARLNRDADRAIGDDRLPPLSCVNAARTAYDKYGNAIAMLDPLGDPADVTITNDASGRRVAASTAKGHLRGILYDPQYFLYPVKETINLEAPKASLAMQAAYDTGLGVMTSSTDFNGYVTSYLYDVYGRLTGIVKPGPSGDSAARPTQRFAYRAANPWTGAQLDYDSNGTVTAIAGTSGSLANSVHTYAREDFADSEGYHTFDTMKFTDGLGRSLMELHEGESASDRFDGKATGPVVASATRFNLRQGAFSAQLPYYGSPNLMDAGGRVGLYVPPADGSTSRTETFPDALGRAVKVVNPPETTSTTRRLFTLTYNLPRETISRDEEQTKAASQHTGSQMIHIQDGLGRLVEVREVVRIADDGNPIDQATTPTQWITRYQYDLQDNLVHIQDSQDNQKWMRHDGLGRKLFMNDPDRGVMVYTYDDASNLVETMDAKAQHIKYAYDGVNRLASEDYLDAAGKSPDVTYHYDAPAGVIDMGDSTTGTAANTKGFLSWVQDLSGEEHNTYDERGRVAWVVKRLPDLENGLPRSFKTAFTYDALDRVRDLIYPDNDAVANIYNSANQLEKITGGEQHNAGGVPFIITGIDYLPSGQTARTGYGNGVVTTMGYDPRLRLASLRTAAGGGAGTSLVAYDYTFDGASNITRIDDRRPGSVHPAGDPLRNTQIFQYDDLYRLTHVQYSFNLPGQADRPADGYVAYRYDRIGNMLDQSSDIDHVEKGKSVTNHGAMTYGATAGRTGRIGRDSQFLDSALRPPHSALDPGPHALTATASGRAYPYDLNGNMTNIDGLAATWDFKDRLVALEDANLRAEYTYDYTDRRVMKRVSAKKRDPLHPLADLATTNTLYIDKFFEVREHGESVKYVWCGKMRVAQSTGTFISGRSRVQRMSLLKGWNLVTLFVDQPSGLGVRDGVGTILRWDTTTRIWQTTSAHTSFAAGSVLFCYAFNLKNLELNGELFEPGGVMVATGGDYAPAPSLDAVTINTNSGDRYTWIYNTVHAQWQYISTAFPQIFLSNTNSFLRSGSAVYLLSYTPSIAMDTIPPKSRLLYFHQDHLGSTSILADADANVITENLFYAFGNPRRRWQRNQPKLPFAKNYLFSQKEQDEESDLQYFEARFFMSSTSHFISVDAMAFYPKTEKGRPQHFNSYSYSYNSPIVLMDTTGNEAEDSVDSQYDNSLPNENGFNAPATPSSDQFNNIAELGNGLSELKKNGAGTMEFQEVTTSVPVIESWNPKDNDDNHPLNTMSIEGKQKNDSPEEDRSGQKDVIADENIPNTDKNQRKDVSPCKREVKPDWNLKENDENRDKVWIPVTVDYYCNDIKTGTLNEWVDENELDDYISENGGD